MRDLAFDIKGRDRTQAAFDSARRNARGFNRDLDLTQRGLNLAGQAARAFAAAFVVTSIADFGRKVREVVSEASQLAKIADKVALSTDALQQLRYGFELTGVAAGQTDVAMQRFSRRIAEAASGGGVLLPILKANNVALRDSNGNMRSQVAILRDYANLIKNAGSSQEQLLLAFKAFDTEGAALVNGLRGGAEGLDTLMRKADEAGGVIDEALIRKAEQIDDDFARITRTIDIGVKNAILQAVAATDEFYNSVDAVAQRWEQLTDIPAPDWLKTLLTVPGAALFPGQIVGGAIRKQLEGDNATPADSRIRDAFSNQQRLSASDMAVADRMRQMFGDGASAPRTIIPAGGGGAARKAKEQVSAYERVIQALQNEKDAIRLNATEQKILTAQRQAGVEASSAQGRTIATMITAIDAEREAMKRLEDQHIAVRDAAEYLGGGLLDTLFSIVDGAESAEEAIKRMGLEILRALTYGALLGQGPFGKLFGGGLLGSLFGGFRAEGGPVDPWGTYVVGEKGPEILRMGAMGGHVTSNSQSFGQAAGGSISIDARIYAPGADAAALARVERSQQELVKKIPKMVESRNWTATQRNTRP